MSDLAVPPARLLEQITAQQARIADLHRALATAERAGRLAFTVPARSRAHLRVDAALMDLEAAAAALDKLLLRHARASAIRRRWCVQHLTV